MKLTSLFQMNPGRNLSASRIASVLSLAAGLMLLSSLGTGGSAFAQQEDNVRLNNSSFLIMTNQEFGTWMTSKDSHLETVNMHPVSYSGTENNPAETDLPGNGMQAHLENYRYILGAGDTIAVKVIGQPSLSREEIMLNTDGLISLPLIGEFQANGKSPSDLEAEISSAYEEYLVAPIVSVVLLKSRPQITYVLGAVYSPGPYIQVSKDSNIDQAPSHVVTTDYRLTTAIANAGGLQLDADLYHVHVFNKQRGYHKEVNLYDLVVMGQTDDDIILHPSDVVYVPRLENNAQVNMNMLKLVSSSNMGKHTFPVRVYGEVASPDVYQLKPEEMTLQSLLAKSGMQHKAAREKIVVARPAEDGKLQKIVVNSEALDMQLRPYDVVMVGKSKVGKIERVAEVLGKVFFLPAVQSGFFLNSMNNLSDD